MQIEATIASLAIMEHVFSIKVASANLSPATVEELKALKGKQQRFIFEVRQGGERLSIEARVQSINIRKKLHFVLHAEKIKPVILKAVELMDKPLLLKFISSKEKALMDLLSTVSGLLGMPEEEVLYQATTFTNKEGKLIEGKRSIFELSERHKEVLLDKLKRMLAGN